MKILETVLLMSFLFLGCYEAFQLSKKLSCRQEAWRAEFLNHTTKKLSKPSFMMKPLCQGSFHLVLKGDL